MYTQQSDDVSEGDLLLILHSNNQAQTYVPEARPRPVAALAAGSGRVGAWVTRTYIPLCRI